MSDNQPVAWAIWIPEEVKPRLLFTDERAAYDAKARWWESYSQADIIPLYRQWPAS